MAFSARRAACYHGTYRQDGRAGLLLASIRHLRSSAVWPRRSKHCGIQDKVSGILYSVCGRSEKGGNCLISSSLASKAAIHQIQLQAGKEMGFSIHINGNAQAVVTKVVTGGAADMAGVRTGSLLASVDGKNILETSMSHSDVLELITRPARHCNIRTFGFVQPMHEGAQRTPCDWHVPAFKGDIGRVHVSQRHKVEHLTHPGGNI